MSPDGQKLWIGNMVWREESSDTLEVNREGLEYRRVGGMLACWAGNKAVAEIAMLKNQGEAEGVEVSGKTILVLWDIATGKQSKIVEAPMALTIERSPDGKWIAEGGNDERIRDAQTLSVLREIPAQDAPVEGLKWHHSKSALVSTGSDQWIRIWTPETGQLLEEFRRVDLSPEGLDISGDGRQLGVGNGAANATEISLPQSFAR
jgi:WD40 repeat protein